MYTFFKDLVLMALVGCVIILAVGGYRAKHERSEMINKIMEMAKSQNELMSMSDMVYENELQIYYMTLGLAYTNKEILKTLDLEDNENIMYIYVVYKPLIDEMMRESAEQDFFPTIKDTVKTWVQSL